MKKNTEQTSDITLLDLPDNEDEAFDMILDCENCKKVKIRGKIKNWYGDFNDWIINNSITYLDLYDLTEMTEWGDPLEYVDGPSGGINYCDSLEEVILPRNLKGLGVNYFAGCSSLHTIHIPAAFEYISNTPEKAPFSDTSLTRIYIELSEKNSWMISDYSNLEIIYKITDERYEEADGVLYDKKSRKLLRFPAEAREEFLLPPEIDSSEDVAFRNCRIRKLVIHGGVKYIGMGAFRGARIDEIIFDEGIEKIMGGDETRPEDPYEEFPYIIGRVFTDSYVRRIVLPSTLKEIGYQLFTGGYCFEDVHFRYDNPVFEIQDGIIYNKQLKSAVSFIPGPSGEYTIREGTIQLGKHLFCREYIGNRSGSIKVSLPESLEYIGEKAFYNSGLFSIYLPGKINFIGKNAFRNCNISEFIIPKGVSSVNEGAFFNCRSLSEIKIPESVETIGRSAFWGCTSLKVVKLPSNLKKLEDGTFNYCKSLESIELPDGISVIGSQCFEECEKLSSITLPEDLTEIYPMAFSECSSLEAVNFPAGLKWIHDGAFMKCTSLKNIELPEGLQNLGPLAFSGCSNMETINIPSGCELYSPGDGFYQFDGCNAIVNLTVADDNPFYTFSDGLLYNKQGNYLIKSFSDKKVIELLDRVSTIGQEAFANTPCIAVIMPDGVQKIGKMAFFNCRNLEHVRFSRNIKEIDSTKFWREEYTGEMEGPYGGLFDKCANLSMITNVSAEILRKYPEIFKNITVTYTDAAVPEKIELELKKPDSPVQDPVIPSDVMEAINSRYFVDPPDVLKLATDIIKYRDNNLVQRTNIYLTSVRIILEHVRNSLQDTGIIPKRCMAFTTGMTILSNNWPDEIIPPGIRSHINDIVKILNSASHAENKYLPPFKDYGFTNNDIIDSCLKMILLAKSASDYRKKTGLDRKGFEMRYRHCIYKPVEQDPEETSDTTVGYIETWTEKNKGKGDPVIRIALVHRDKSWHKVRIHIPELIEYYRRTGYMLTEDQKVQVRFEERTQWNDNPIWVATELLRVLSKPLFDKT